MNEERAALVAEQFSHTVDMLRAEQGALKAERQRDMELFRHRLVKLERQGEDFEARLRGLTESATQFKFLVSLAAGGGLLSVVTLIRLLVQG